MSKYLWLVGGLAFGGVLAFAGWQRSVERRAAAENRAAAAALTDTQRGERDDPRQRSQPTSKPAQSQPSTNATSRASTVSGPSSTSNVSAPGDVDVPWQAAVGLPAQVREQLGTSHDPVLQEIFERNARLSQARADDSWGSEMQKRLNEFFDSRSEAEGLQITVACRQAQCQIQVIDPARLPAGDTPPSQVLFDELRDHWWFRDRLTMAQGRVTTVNGRLYHVQYFDRKQ